MDRQLQIVLKLQDQASAELRKVTAVLNEGHQSTTRFGGAMDYLETAAKRAAIGLGATAAAALAFGVNYAAQVETAQVGLSTLLGSAQKGAETMQQIKTASMKTPFELPGLAAAVQLMASVTHDGDAALKVIMDVGEGLAAMGKGQPELDRVIINLQQVAALGHAQMIDIKQFAYAGIPIFEMLTQQTGLTGEALSKFISNGGVTFQVLSQMFDKANDEGGRFFNAFKNQSGTFNQALSNMKDSIGIFLADVVTSTGIFDGLKIAMIDASNWLMNYKQHLAELKEAMTELMEKVDEHTGIVTAFKEAWGQVTLTWETSLQPALLKLKEALEPLKPTLELIARLLGVAVVFALSETGKQIANAIKFFATLITDLTKGSAWILSAFLPMIHSIGTEFQWVIDKVNALISAFSRLTGIKSSTAAGIGSSVGSGLFNGALNMLPGLNVLPFASGGIVTQPTLGLVGEAGPEAIIPLSQMGRMGGVTVNVYGDVSGQALVDQVTESLMQRLSSNSRFAI